ncbi:hypothetical protein CN481_13720 [Bacillus sp. AFS006103]|nr:hypothetical protein CN481_13720 [Bacillus sp. AFS006103]
MSFLTNPINWIFFIPILVHFFYVNKGLFKYGDGVKNNGPHKHASFTKFAVYIRVDSFYFG